MATLTLPIVETNAGPVIGRRLGALNLFKGVPYAAPPIGGLRWKPPEPARGWRGARAADTFGPACPQPTNVNGAPNLGGYAGPTDEDCLTLNIWTPAQRQGAKLPVMVWILAAGSWGDPAHAMTGRTSPKTASSW